MTVHIGKQDSPEVAAAKVAKLRAEEKLPPQGSARAFAAKYRNPNEVQIDSVNSGIGDCLKAEFAAWNVEFLPSCNCRALQAKLNRMTPEKATEAIESLVDDVHKNVRHAAGVKGAALKALDWTAPEIIKGQIRECLTKCIEQAKHAV